jgi:hypothetical protein
MTNKLITMFVFSIFFSLQSLYAQKPIELVLPKTPFDLEMAMKMLNTGNSEIKGVAFYENRRGLIGPKVGSIYARSGTVVTLYPITPYFAEFLELRKKDKKDKRMAAISTDVNSFRILSKVYSAQGDFVFKGLAPGKYYLETTVFFPSGIGGEEVAGIAEVKTDGESVKVELKHTFRVTGGLFGF